jgi:adenylate cyclase, class 2
MPAGLEVETKVLAVKVAAVTRALAMLGARQTLATRLMVDWYGPPGLTHIGDDPWYLRLRSQANGTSELTWKSLGQHIGNTRQSQEINLSVDDPKICNEFLQALGFEKYAHQEKDRTSFIYKDWRFDLDQYPGMPAYLEIEGRSEAHVAEAIRLLGLEDHRAVSEGERRLIQEAYRLNWNDMRF